MKKLYSIIHTIAGDDDDDDDAFHIYITIHPYIYIL